MRYCKICGRALRKSPGPIGPRCQQKVTAQIKSKIRPITIKDHKFLQRHDIFAEVQNG